MNAVGIDVSKGKSKIAIIRSYGEVVAKPFPILITYPDLRARFLSRLTSFVVIVPFIFIILSALYAGLAFFLWSAVHNVIASSPLQKNKPAHTKRHQKITNSVYWLHSVSRRGTVNLQNQQLIHVQTHIRHLQWLLIH